MLLRRGNVCVRAHFPGAPWRIIQLFSLVRNEAKQRCAKSLKILNPLVQTFILSKAPCIALHKTVTTIVTQDIKV